MRQYQEVSLGDRYRAGDSANVRYGAAALNDRIGLGMVCHDLGLGDSLRCSADRQFEKMIFTAG